jgi:hypothetical protein
MNKLIYYVPLSVLLLFSSTCFSQQVIAAAGGSGSGTDIQLSWTIGEPIIETFTGTSLILTQGFHQSKLNITTIEPISFHTLELKVYPNPFSDQLNINIIKGEWNNLYFRLYTTGGKLLMKNPFQNQVETLNMEPYASGIYFLKVICHTDGLEQTFIVVKN